MHRAWLKAVVLQVALWSYPYAKGGDFRGRKQRGWVARGALLG